MYAQMLISLREGFEAALLIAIVLIYLKRMNLESYSRHLILGGLAGILLSGLVGICAFNLYLLFEEKELAEAIGAFIAVPLLTSVLYWMAVKGRNLKESIEEDVRTSISLKGTFGIFILGFVLVLREGVETVAFLLPLIFSRPYATFIGVTIGSFLAVAISYLIFIAGMKISIRNFFYYTSILIVFVASGILGYGIHELMEYLEEKGVELGLLSMKVYDLGLSSTHILHEENILGSILSVMFGYTSTMKLLRFILQFAYLVMGLLLIIYAYKVRDLQD